MALHCTGALTLANVSSSVAFNCIGIYARSAAAANMLAAGCVHNKALIVY